MEKVNYNRIFNETVAGLAGRPTLLLHVCCAPCLAGVIGRVEDSFDVTLYYFNPNILPKREYDKRLAEIKKYIKLSGRSTPIVCGKYEETGCGGAVSGYEKSEGGSRCSACCAFRAGETAKYAAERGFGFFCTTLSVSPHKNAAEINESMKAAGETYGVKPLFADFKKEGGFLKSTEECEKYGVYRQNYCGCSPRKLKVYVTGGLASGKSELTGILRSLGAYTISADEVYKSLSAEGAPLNEQLKKRFPSAATNGRLDRAVLKALVFGDKTELDALNAITHGEIMREVDKIADGANAKIVVIEVPLLFESGIKADGLTVTVSADEDKRRDRAAKRDGISGEMFTAIAANQFTDSERESFADVSVFNSGDMDELKKKAEELYSDWLKNV